MSEPPPRNGETVRWNGSTWQVERLRDGGLQLVNVESGECHDMTLGEWFGGVEMGVLEPRSMPPILASRRPRKGAFLRWKGVTWRVCVVRSGIINLQNADTDESGAITVKDWQDACFSGKAEMLDDRGSEVNERIRELLTVPMCNMPEKMRAKGDHAALFFEAWRDPDGFYARYLPDVPVDARLRPRTRSKTKVEPLLAVVAEVHGVAPPGFSTFCKWLDKVGKAGGDIRGMLPRHDRQGPHIRYMSARVEQWLRDVIDAIWLTGQKNTKQEVYDELSSKVSEWNDANPDYILWCPSSGHVARFIREEVDRKVVVHRRGSKEEADRTFRQVGQGIQTTRVLERVEVDHSLIRINVLDDRTRVSLGFPWATAAIDHYSRMPLGLHLNFENQSLGANLQCLRMVMSPKGFLRKLVPELDYDYPWGFPFGFFFDRGPDYDHPTMRRVGQSLDIIIDYEPTACPEYKGTIERWWRTLKEDVIRGLPGAVGRDGRRSSGIGDDGDAYITYSELVRRMWQWVSMVYAKRYHRGIDDVPLRRWQESASRHLPRAPRKQDDLNILLTRVEKVPVRKTGVTWNGLTWHGEPLENIMRHPGFRPDMEVEVRIDEYDVADAWVIHPFTRKDEKLKPTLADYMQGLSVHAHDRILKQPSKAGNGTLDQRALMQAKDKLRREKERQFADAAARKRGKVSPAVAKYAGIGQQAPYGDDLGGVLPLMPDRAASRPFEAPTSVNAAELVRIPKPKSVTEKFRNNE